MLSYTQQDSSGSTGDGSSSYAMVPSQSSAQGVGATPPASGVVTPAPQSMTGSADAHPTVHAPTVQLHRHEYRTVNEANEENTAHLHQYNQANIDASQTLTQTYLHQ